MSYVYGPTTSSGLVSSSSAIFTGPGLVYGITLLQASAACTAILYDNATTNSGTAIAQLNNNTNTSTVNEQFTNPIRVNKGCYLALTGTGANAIVTYTQG